MSATKKTKKKPVETYKVSIDCRWSDAVLVSARTKGEAKTKAFKKYLRNLRRKDFNIDVEKH
ncbi:hypothetical protein NXX53_06555 [Bacteroides salyersiae]|uniref:hypothetical protein n=1 Tax=uncultured Bacteroides sp. TaxID=162156 RepID=UPI0025E6B8D5|nr:hypothetical protein [uncultured Bacteroides sp.]MCS2956937.1 hypothetical protein [Bacteroides salyersiae]